MFVVDVLGLFFPAYHQLREEERKGSFADSKLVAAILAFKDSENILHRRGSIPDKFAKIENVGGYIVNFCLAVYTAQDALDKSPSGNNLPQLDPVVEGRRSVSSVRFLFVLSNSCSYSIICFRCRRGRVVLEHARTWSR